MRHILILCLLVFVSLFAENNATSLHRVEVIVTVAGMQESAEAVRTTAREIAVLTRKLSERSDFSAEDREHIDALSRALERNAAAVEKIADVLPAELSRLQNGAGDLLDRAEQNAHRVVVASKQQLVDPTLERIRTQFLLFIALLALLLFGLVWYTMRQLRRVVETGSETVENIRKTMASVEKVVDRVNRSDDGWQNY